MSTIQKSKSVTPKRGSRKKNINQSNTIVTSPGVFNQLGNELENLVDKDITIMNDSQSRDDVKAAREAKKLAKQKAKNKGEPSEDKAKVINQQNKTDIPKEQPKQMKSKDEVDRAVAPVNTVNQVPESQKDKDIVKAERAAKKVSKQAKKKGDIIENKPNVEKQDMTVRDVIETLRDIKNVTQQVKEITDKVQALDLDKKLLEKPNEQPKERSEKGTKSKAELRAERRTKQETQRAAKETAAQEKAAAAKPKEVTQLSKEAGKALAVKEKSPKPKTPSKQSTKQQGHKVNWFRHLYNDDIKAKLNNIPINSNLHPAIIKLGVQLATRVVTGSNARCIALLDALKKMVRDYSLPAKTEFGRGLESHLAASLEFLWTMRQPTASQTNAVKFFRHHITQLPNNVDEFDAKKTLQEEIDRYIREQIDMAGEAISITVRKKISNGDTILTYGCSSLIERILVEAHAAGVKFRACVCGGGDTSRAAKEMTRRLTAVGIACNAIDITAIGSVMRTVDKVVLGASSLLANGSVLAAAGTAAVALAAKGNNIPVLVACETHKFTDRVQTDAFVYNEIGDPDDLIMRCDGNSPLKDWRSNPNLTPLNLAYDVTPPSLVTAVVTELAILPCTSAPVVLRFKLSEYNI